MAIAVVIGAAFNKIVTSLVNDIIMPLITWALGANSLADLAIVLQRDAEGIATLTWNYGNFIQSLIDFLIIALTIFIVLKIMMKSSELLKDVAHKVKPTNKEENEYLVEKGVDLKDKAAVKAALLEREKEIADKKKAKEDAKKEEEYRNSTEGLLKEIRDLLKENKTNEADGKKLSKEEKAEKNKDSKEKKGKFKQ